MHLTINIIYLVHQSKSKLMQRLQYIHLKHEKFLAKQKDQVFSREQLLERVWGYEYYGDIRTVDVTVRRLREKVEDDSSNPTYIMTKRGVGYYFKGE